MRKWFCVLLSMIALVLLGCSTPSVSTGVKPVHMTWPEGWPAEDFPVPAAGDKLSQTYLLGGSGMHVDAIVLTTSGTAADAQKRLDAEAPKLGLQAQQGSDAVIAELKGIFSQSSITITNVWARQDGDKMRAVALGTQADHPVIMYAMRQTSWTPRPLPADWPADVELPPNTEVASQSSDLQSHRKLVMLYTKMSRQDLQQALKTTLESKGFTPDAGGKPIWRKDTTVVSIVEATVPGSMFIVQYPVNDGQA